MNERLLESLVNAPPQHLTEVIRELDSNAERVNADCVAQMHFGGSDGVATDPSEIGPVIPPYDHLWIDATVAVDLRLGMSIKRYECEECCTDGSRHYIVHFFSDGTPGLLMNRVMQFSVDQDGLWASTDWFDNPLRPTPSEDADGGFGAILLPILWTSLGLMNCRNVTLREVAPSLTRQQRRNKKVTRFTYRVIELPQPRRTSRSTTSSGVAAVPKALHRIRGHFKTYTAEAPLLGKHIGTYWWGWQARGSVEAGVSLHDYEVGVSA